MARTTAGQRQVVRDFGTCYQVTGTQHASMADTATLRPTSITTSAWIKLTSNTGTQTFIRRWFNSGYIFRTDGSTHLQLQLHTNADKALNGITALPTGSWTHIVATYNAITGLACLYINSVLDNSTTHTGGNITYGTSDSIYTGGYGFSENLKGKIDDLRVYSTDLTPAQVYELYSTHNVVAVSPVGFWKMDEGSGSTLLDSSGNGLNFTINSGTYSSDVFMIPRIVAPARTAVSVTRFPADDILYLPTGWNTEWLAAKSASSSTPAYMAFIGDSVTQGFNATNQAVNAWTELVRTNTLITKSLYADYYPTHNSTAYSAGYTGTPPFVWNYSTSLVFNKHGWERMPGFTGTTPATTLTFTTPSACTQIDFYYVNFASGTFDYKVDGGGANTITTNKTGAGTDAVITKVSITGLSNTTHTVVFGNQTTTNVMLIMGCATYNSTTTGIGFVRNAAAGAEAFDFNGSTTWATEDRITFWSGVNPQSLPYGSTYTFGFPMQPHLAIIAYGINDCTNLRSRTSFKSILTRYITALRLGRANCSIILLANCMPDTAVSDVTSGVTNGKYWYLYLDVMRDLARDYNCAFVNINAKWGLTPVAQGFMNNNGVHPIDAGHANIASVLNGII